MIVRNESSYLAFCQLGKGQTGIGCHKARKVDYLLAGNTAVLAETQDTVVVDDDVRVL